MRLPADFASRTNGVLIYGFDSTCAELLLAVSVMANPFLVFGTAVIDVNGLDVPFSLRDRAQGRNC